MNAQELTFLLEKITNVSGGDGNSAQSDNLDSEMVQEQEQEQEQEIKLVEENVTKYAFDANLMERRNLGQSQRFTSADPETFFQSKNSLRTRASILCASHRCPLNFYLQQIFLPRSGQDCERGKREVRVRRAFVSALRRQMLKGIPGLS